MQENFLDLALGRCRYLEAGSGEAVLVLHGMGAFTSADNVAPLAQRLAPRFRVVAPDLLGFGMGVRELAEGPTFELMLEHLRELMDVLAIPRAHVVGHSLGGWIGGLLAYQSPQRVERLVLLCAAGMNRTPAPGIRLRELPAPHELRAQLVAALRNPSAADADVLDAATAAAYRAGCQPGALTGLEPLLHQMETPVLRERYLLQRRLPFIGAPALMAFGEGDVFDPYPTWNAEWEALDGDLTRSTKPWVIPGARFARLPTGHFPQLEAPDVTAALVAEFLQRT